MVYLPVSGMYPCGGPYLTPHRLNFVLYAWATPIVFVLEVSSYACGVSDSIL